MNQELDFARIQKDAIKFAKEKEGDSGGYATVEVGRLAPSEEYVAVKKLRWKKDSEERFLRVNPQSKSLVFC